MSIQFTHKRLYVGHRQEDWSKVWCQPDIANKNEEGEAEIRLYKLTIGKAGYREPMEDEVVWLPHFDPKNCEAATLPAKKRKQQQDITDAYEYLAEKDPEKVHTMEEELDERKSPRWQSWFTEAKKFKKRAMKRRDARRKARILQAREAGATHFEIQKQVNSDTSDSAYESEQENGERASSIANMPPPTGAKKRKSASNTEGRWTASRKKRSDIPGGWSNRRRSLPRISGARGSSVLSSRKATFSADASAREESTELDDEFMDSSDPNIQVPGLRVEEKGNLKALITPCPTWMSSDSAGPENGTIDIKSDQNQVSGNGNGQQLDGKDNIVDPGERAARHIREQSMSGMNNEEAFQEALRRSLGLQEREEGEHVVEHGEQVAESIEQEADEF